jgi:outer membrane murein-binding lipoprotein Lpp
MNWLKNKLGLKNLEKKLDMLQSKIEEIEKEVDNLTDDMSAIENEIKFSNRTDADINFRLNNTVIVTGAFRGQGYVRFFDLGDTEFEDIIEILQERSKISRIREIDGVRSPTNFSAQFKLDTGHKF